MKTRLALIATLALAMGTACGEDGCLDLPGCTNCCGGDDPDPGVPDDPGLLVLHLDVFDIDMGDAAGARELRLEVDRVDVVIEPLRLDGSGIYEEEQVLELTDFNATLTLPLATSDYRVPRHVAEFVVVPGLVHQLRFVISDAHVLRDGILEPIKIPSGDTSGLKFNAPDDAPFLIEDQFTTSIVGRIDGGSNGQIHESGVGLTLRPTIPTDEIPFPIRNGFEPNTLVVAYEASADQAAIDAFEDDINATVLSVDGGVRVLRFPDGDYLDTVSFSMKSGSHRWSPVHRLSRSFN